MGSLLANILSNQQSNNPVYIGIANNSEHVRMHLDSHLKPMIDKKELPKVRAYSSVEEGLKDYTANFLIKAI